MIALEYISHGLKQKYSGYCGTVLFLMGCTAYFFVVTGLNHYTSFEGALGIGYGVVLYVYCLLAAEGRKSDFFLLSVVWVLLAFISAYVMFAVWGMFFNGENSTSSIPEEKTKKDFSRRLADGSYFFDFFLFNIIYVPLRMRGIRTKRTVSFVFMDIIRDFLGYYPIRWVLSIDRKI